MPSLNPFEDAEGLVSALDADCWIGAGRFDNEWCGPSQGYFLFFPSADHVVACLRDSVFTWEELSEADPAEAEQDAEISAWIDTSRAAMPPEQLIPQILERADSSGDFTVTWLGSVHAYLDELGNEEAPYETGSGKPTSFAEGGAGPWEKPPGRN